ncbi:MAG: hypothetical protein Q9201_007049 [Fulgogasparrea decipioides]
MGMRLPGGINGETEFWDMLVNKKDGRCMVPKDRYNVEAFYSPTDKPGTVKSKYGYFLNHLDLQHLDASFFSMNKTEVEKLDPQQRLLLEVVWECMENGGQMGWRGRNIGCYVEQGVLSPTGFCKTFDAQADGYARGEAINAVYVKKLSDAIQDGDPIRAVIRATATNCDGKTPGMACPSSESHESLMRRAYRTARLPDLSQTAFVECHGTGTAIGDPLETSAVANTFGQQGVKPNVGHSEGASGTTSLVKAALALEHKIIPPNINFSEPNPKIPFGKGRLQVPLEAIPWPEGRERASVNLFGIGGANAHVVVDAVSSFVRRPAINGADSTGTARPHLLVFSAGHLESLSRIIENHRHFVKQNPYLLRDLAYTLGARREHLPHRAFCVTDAKAPLEISPITKSKSTPQIVFVFTGQGAQWAGMAKQLWEIFDVFRDAIREMDEILAVLRYPPSWTIEEELTKSENASRIDEAEFSQPLCTALQIGICKLMSLWGVAPAAVVGHSSGEIAAAYASNAITAKVAITVAYYRGQVSKKPLHLGGMLAVGMGRDLVTPYLIEGVVIACENSPDNITLSGDKEQINKVAVAIADKQPETFVRHLKVGTAYHSRKSMQAVLFYDQLLSIYVTRTDKSTDHMEEVGTEYYRLISDHLPTSRLDVPFYSSVTGKGLADRKQLGPSYWRQNLESPVLFHSATRTILEQLPQGSLFLEIGPHSALAGPLRQIFKTVEATTPPLYLPTLVRGKHGTASLLTALGQMHLLDVPINFEAGDPWQSGPDQSADLPMAP